MYSPQLEQLIAELQALSPMPDDEDIAVPLDDNQDSLEIYTQVTERIMQKASINYPLEVIPSLLESLGVGEGFGVYWSIIHFIEKFPQKNEVYALIQQISNSSNPGTRKWCCLMMGRRRNVNDLPFLVERLQDTTAVVRCYALMAIEMIAQRHTILSAIPPVTNLLQDKDENVRTAAGETLTVLKKLSK